MQIRDTPVFVLIAPIILIIQKEHNGIETLAIREAVAEFKQVIECGASITFRYDPASHLLKTDITLGVMHNDVAPHRSSYAQTEIGRCDTWVHMVVISTVKTFFKC